MSRRGGLGRLRWKLLVAVPLVALLLALVGRAFVGQVLVLRSGSMEPTLFGSEGDRDWVLVLYGAPKAWRRGDLAVFRQPGADAPAVKRATGLPGETVQLSGGDLFVDGEATSALGSEALWIPWWGPGAEPVAEWFERDGGEGGPWSVPEPGVERVDAREISGSSNRGRMFLRYDVDLGYLRPDGRRVRETAQANDLRVRLGLRIAEADLAGVDGDPAVLRVELVEEADQFWLELRPRDDGTAELQLLRRSENSGPWVPLAEAEVELRPGAWHALVFSNRDDRITVNWDGAAPLEVEYDGNEPYRGDVPNGAKSVGPRVAIGASRLAVDLRELHVDRDVYYLGASAFGDYGIGRPLRLGPDELYLLGDHSNDSLDSRRFGAVNGTEIVGRAAAIVWPPSRWRRLGGR